MRTADYGQFVGSDLDRSGGHACGHAPSHTPPHVEAGHARPLQLDKIKTSRPNRRDGSFLCE